MSEIYLILYIIVWLLTFLRYQRRVNSFDAGSFILLCYLIFAVASYFLWINPFYKGDYKEIHLFPFVYLYIFTMISTSPILKYNSTNIKSIASPSHWFAMFISITYIISSLTRIPYLITHIQDGLMKIMMDSTVGNEVYWNALDNAADGGSGVSSLFSILSGALSGVGMLLFFYELSEKSPNKKLLLGLGASTFITAIGPIADGFRGGTVLQLFGILITYFAFRKFLSSKINSIIKKVGIVFIVVISIPILIMTISRFGERSEGTLGSMVCYAGQENLNFNNYGLDANGIRYGDRTINLVKRVFFDDVPKNYMERRAKYPHMKMNDSVYYTYVGDFTLDFGPVGAAIIIILFTMLINQIKIRNGTIEFHDFILVSLVMQICAKGAMTSFSFSDTGNISLIMYFILYFAFKFERRKFPKI